ncbi:MAG: histidine kinase [Prolixibacteraceae bacterium]|jgi:hypothetical protein|nr:histidine kinase [Prolixibacteraceae bacterium]
MVKKQVFNIFLHIFAWTVYLFLPNVITEQEFVWGRFVLRNKEIVLLLIYFYLNIYLIIPKSLENKKTGRFIAFTLMAFAVYVVVEPAIDYLAFKKFLPDIDGGFREFRNRMVDRGYHISSRSILRNVGQILFFFAISTGWKLYQRWRLEEKQKDLAQKERLAAELSLLKSQVSPHFLFNSLNSIYSLTVQKSESAPLAVVKLSELLRYMIYQANRELVPLSEELNYIGNFIELQKLRIAGDMNIRYEVNVQNKSAEIEPMLLIPIIENTFKHGVSYKEPSEIVIRIEERDKRLHLYTCNHIFLKKKTESSGFGLENLKKRLTLRDAGSYHLKIEEKGKEYVVNFSLKLGQ